MRDGCDAVPLACRRVTTTAVVLATSALVLSLASLGWQAWTWLHSGPVIRVHTSNTITPGYGAGHYVEVKAINHGRAAATITNWGIAVSDRENLFVTQRLPMSDDLPARVEPHASVSMYVEADELRRVAAERRVPFAVMKPWVQSATGRKTYASKGVPLA